MNGPAPLQRAVYVVSQFPCLSETFIVREIDALLGHGVDVRILSLKHASTDPLQSESAALLARVHHPGSLPHTLLGALRAGLEHPRAVLRAHATILADSWRRPAVAAKSLFA
jgi:hypothetical protein